VDEARDAGAGSELVVLPACVVVVRGLAVLSRELPIDVRDTGRGGATRDDADGGATTRAWLVVATARPDALVTPDAPDAPGEETAEVSFAASLGPEAFAAELAGAFPFTKRCSLASYTIAEPAAEAAVALEFTVRVRRAGDVEALTCEVKTSLGGSFTTFHLVLAASAD
jgi:hypothetical protein